MTTLRSQLNSTSNTLSRHLSRLGDNLQGYADRLRDTVSSAIGETVAGVVRETVRAVLTYDLAIHASQDRYATPHRQQRIVDPENWTTG